MGIIIPIYSQIYNIITNFFDEMFSGTLPSGANGGLLNPTERKSLPSQEASTT
jgi:hypothetical protein